MDYSQVDSTSHSNQRQAPRPQSMLYLSAIKDNSLEASIRMLKDRLYNCEHDHSIPPDLLLTSLPRTLRPLDTSVSRDTADEFSGQLNLPSPVALATLRTRPDPAMMTAEAPAQMIAVGLPLPRHATVAPPPTTSLHATVLTHSATPVASSTTIKHRVSTRLSL
jgi:hypothetical protein